MLREVRLGEMQWESVQDLKEALDAVRTRRTRQDMQAVLDAQEKYRSQTGSYPATKDFDDLIDKLSPRYLDRLVRFDRWSHEYRMVTERGKPGILSDGPDGKAGTGDDVRLP